MKRFGFYLGTTLMAAVVTLAAPAVAAPAPASSPSYGPAQISAPSTGGTAATADASNGPGNAGKSAPASSVCTQDMGNKTEGASVNSTGTQCFYDRAATDGTIVGPALLAVPQLKVQRESVAVPAS